MTRPVFLFVLMLAAQLACAQVFVLPQDSVVDLPAMRSHQISFRTWADQAANTVYNELPWAIYQGGYISRELRQRSLDQLVDRNRAGYELGARVSWTGADSLFGKARLRPMVSVAYHNLLGLRFSPDVYALAFFGNARYEDRTAYLSPSAHEFIAWESAGFGIQDSKSRSFVRLDLVRGRSLNASELRKAELYTAPDGRLLDVTMDASYWQSDTAGQAWEHSNGAGVSISGMVNVLRRIGTTAITTSLAVEDAGFMRWSDNTVRVERDTVFAYEGLNVENIFDLDNLLVGEAQLLDTFGLRYTRGGQTRLLPMRATLAFDVHHAAWWARASMDHRHIAGYRPQVMLHAGRRLGERVLLALHGSYGGFGAARLGIASRIRFGHAVLLELGSSHVPGLLLGNARGVGIHFGLVVGFGTR
jgi:hypothetical protein